MTTEQTLEAILAELRAANKISIMGQTVLHQLLNGIRSELALANSDKEARVEASLAEARMLTEYTQALSERMDEFNELVHPYLDDKPSYRS